MITFRDYIITEDGHVARMDVTIPGIAYGKDQNHDPQYWSKERVAEEANRPEIIPEARQDYLKILVNWPSTEAEDAARWRALVHESARLRLMGTSGFSRDSAGRNRTDDDGYRHFGMEAWTQHPAPPCFEARWVLIDYADSLRNTKSSKEKTI